MVVVLERPLLNLVEVAIYDQDLSASENPLPFGHGDTPVVPGLHHDAMLLLCLRVLGHKFASQNTLFPHQVSAIDTSSWVYCSGTSYLLESSLNEVGKVAVSLKKPVELLVGYVNLIASNWIVFWRASAGNNSNCTGEPVAFLYPSPSTTTGRRPFYSII